jgi:hypothetical protein
MDKPKTPVILSVIPHGKSASAANLVVRDRLQRRDFGMAFNFNVIWMISITEEANI